MKTKIKFILVLGVMIIAIVTSGVPFGRQGQGASKTSNGLAECYKQDEIQLLMENNHCDRVRAEELLRLSCMYAITPESE